MSLEDDIALLSRVPVLADMGREALRLLAFAAEMRQLHAGDVLFRRGDVADAGYVVASGSFIMTDNEAGAEIVVGPGSLIGELALISELQRSATATARGSCVVLRISRPMFRRTLEEYPEVAQHLSAYLRRRLSTLSEDLARVKRRLQEQSDK